METAVFEKVKETLSDALGVEVEEIQMESSLVNDLGAESIDFIDIIFRLEKAFDIKIPSGDLFPGNILNDEKFVQGGVVTDAGMQELKTKIPYLNIEAFQKDPQVAKLADHFNVKMLVEYLQARLAEDAKA